MCHRMETLTTTMSVCQGTANEIAIDRKGTCNFSMSSDCQKPFKSVPECSVASVSELRSDHFDCKYSDAQRVDRLVPQV